MKLAEKVIRLYEDESEKLVMEYALTIIQQQLENDYSYDDLHDSFGYKAKDIKKWNDEDEIPLKPAKDIVEIHTNKKWKDAIKKMN